MEVESPSSTLPTSFCLHLIKRVGRIRRTVKQRWRDFTSPRMTSVQPLADRDFLALFRLEDVSTRLHHDDVIGATAALLAHYGGRVRCDWPGFASRIADYKIDLHTVSDEDLMTRADLILEHRFVLNGLPEVPMGEGVDWHYQPTSDLEWTWELNRHKWLPVLATAYVQTGRECYAAKLINLLVHWIENNPPPLRKNERSPTWRLMEVGMRMYLSWIPAFGLLYHLPTFSDAAKLKILRAICDHARFLSRFKSQRNHLLRESIGLAYIALYFPEFREADHWRQEALARLDQGLTQQFYRDGSHIEMSTGYQWLAVDEYQYVYDLLQATNGSLPRENLGVRLEIMYHVLVYMVRPDYTFPQVNDGMMAANPILLDKLARAGEILKRDDFIYVGSQGCRGTRPIKTSVEFPNAGWYVMRSDWHVEARYLLFDAGPYGGVHGHEDYLNIELYAFGQCFLVDPGTYTYNRNDPFREYFVSSASHNVVLVDGKSQVRRWNRANFDLKPVVGRDARWCSQTTFDYVAATYDQGYGHFSMQRPPDAVITEVRHTRRLLFVKPHYWVMLDELQAATPHAYQLLFHTPPEVSVYSGAENRVMLSVSPNGDPGLYLIPVEPQRLKVHQVVGSENPISGWYSSIYNHKVPSATVIYERENSASAVMTTLLYPCPTGQTADAVTIRSLPVSGGPAWAFVVETDQGKDVLMFSQENTLKQFDSYQSTAIVAGIRMDKYGKVFSHFEWEGHHA